MTYYEQVGIVVCWLLASAFCYFVGGLTGLFLWGIFTGGMMGYEAGRLDR